MPATISNLPNRYQFGDLTLEAGPRRVKRGQEPLDVGGLTFDFLRTLVESAPNVVSYDELAEKVWGGRPVSPETITQRAMMLRHALSDEADHPRYFEVVRGQGYRMIADVAPLHAKSARVIPNKLRLGLVAAVVFAIGVSLIAGWQFLEAPGVGPPSSVAVLPFENLTLDPENAFFATGIHEEVLNQLAKLRNLRVIPRTSVLRYADTELSTPEIARELNVESVMTGTVRYADDRIRITIRLVHGLTDALLWFETYEREFADIFAIESDIAVQVADALQAELSLSEQDILESEPTSSPEAYQLFLQALAIHRLDSEHAVLLLKNAVGIDPDFGLAFAYRAAYNSGRLINTTNTVAQAGAVNRVNASELEAEIRRDAQRALAIDPNLSPAHSALAQIYVWTWRWAEARQAYQQALANPTLVEVDRLLHMYALFNAWDGRPEEAITLELAALKLDPASGAAHMDLGMVYGFAGNPEAAILSLLNSIALFPASGLAHAWIGLMQVVRGEDEDAVAQLQAAERVYGGYPPTILLPTLAYGYGLLSRREDAARLFAEFEKRSLERVVGTGGWVTAYLAIRDRDSALDWMKQAVDKARNHEYDAAFLNLMNIQLNVFNDPILEEPEFVALRRELVGR